MFKATINGWAIDIALTPGIYFFDCVSASGKSFLMFLLDTIAPHANISLCTYSTYKYARDFKPELELIMFDRFDMYSGEFDLPEIAKKCPNAIILVDCKEGLDNIGTFAEIELTEGSIKVS